MYHDLLRFLWISLLPNLRLEGLLKDYLRNQLLKSTTICVTLVCCLSYFWLIVSWIINPSSIPFFKRSQIHTAGAYLKAAVLIVIAYATLLVINTRYISLAIVPILMLVFIGALFVDISLKGSFNLDEDDRNNEDKDGLFATAVLPCCVLCCMGHFNVENLVISQFLLFLTATLGELTLMMARLPHVAPAFEVIRRASLVVVVVTAHAMAAELLGDDAVLVCTPELIAALLWLSIHMDQGDGDSSAAITATIRKATSPQAFIVVLGALLVVLHLQYYQASSSTGEPGEPAGVILLSWYMWALVACAFSGVLPSLCVFALREWPGQTVANPSGLDGAVLLLSYCRDVFTAAFLVILVATPLVDARLGSQVQGLVANTWSKFVDRRVVQYSN